MGKKFDKCFKFNRIEVSPICPLCKLAPENLRHFLLECPSLQHVRGGYLGELEQALLRVVPGCAAQFLADVEIVPHCHGLYCVGRACRCGTSGWIV